MPKVICIHCGTDCKTKANLLAHLEDIHRGSTNRVARTCISCPPPNNVFVDLEEHFIQLHGMERREKGRTRG